MGTINDFWDDYSLWLEKNLLHDEEAPGWLTTDWEFLGYVDGEEVWLETG